VVIMHHPDIGEFLDLIARYRVTHTFLPPTVIYTLLDHPKLESADLSSLQCLLYGAAPISVARLTEALEKIGPMAQLFGQTEAPMMISMMPPEDHYNPDGSIATGRLSSAGRIGPLVRVGIMDGDGNLMPAGERGEIVVSWIAGDGWVLQERRSNGGDLVHGWHHTGDIGYLDAGQFPLHRRSRKRHDHYWRLQRLFRRGRERPSGPRNHSGLCRHRFARREVGRTRCRCGAAESRTHSRCPPRYRLS